MRLIALMLLLLASGTALAEDYYCVSTTGTKTSGVSTTDIDAFGWANADCYGTIQAAVTQMSAGSQVWVNDGSYSTSGSCFTVTSAKSGSAGNFTIIKARNANEVDLTSSGGSGAYIDNDAAYVWVEGFHVVSCHDNGAAFYIDGANHIMLKRCSLEMDNFFITAGSQYVTVEDCFAYGGPLRYPFQTSNGGGDTGYVVYRRCVVRWDWSNNVDPQAAFASYSTDHIAYQNCVAVDCTDNKGYEAVNDGACGFFTPNGGGPVSFDGCMVVAGTGFGGFRFEGSPFSDGTMNNCVVWGIVPNAGDATDGYPASALAQYEDTYQTLDVNQCTFGAVEYTTGYPLLFDNSGIESMKNSIIYGMTLGGGYYAVSGNLNTHDYNLYYGNTGSRNKLGGVAAHDVTATDPTTSGLFYVTQIEPCSACQTLGENGTQIGAQIRTKIGADGTFYGDTDWDLDTGDPLWPWPYEDQIRERCAAYHMDALEAYSIAGGDDFDSPEIDGARGFCSGSWTLSNYLRAGGE